MSDNQKPQELDFFQEALRALEAPISEDKTKVQETVRLAPAIYAPVPVQEALLPRPPFIKKWWPALLCGLICCALLVVFAIADSRYDVRSANRLYARLTEIYDDAIVVTDINDDRWYVQCKDVALPKNHLPGVTRVWIFYDGEPQEITKLNCTKQVKATQIESTYPKALDGLEQYGLVYDDICFDLDGDRKVEHWYVLPGSVADVPTDLLHEQVDGSYMCLLALDDAGEELYHILFRSVGRLSHVFANHDGKLTLTALNDHSFVTMDIRYEDGEVLVYHGEERRFSVPCDHTDRVVTETLGPSMLVGIRFEMLGFSGLLPTTDWLEMSGDTIPNLKNTLDSLSWVEDESWKDVRPFIRFYLLVNGAVSEYQFSTDGKLMCDGKVVQMTEELLLQIIRLMGQDDYDNTVCIGKFPNEDTVQMELFKNGTALFSINPNLVSRQVTRGSYGILGDYLIFSNGYEGRDKSSVFYVFRKEGESICYIQSFSNVSDEAWQLDDGIRIIPEDCLRLKVQIGFGGDEGDPDAVTTEYFYLDSEDMKWLRNLLDNQIWWTNPAVKDWSAMGFLSLEYMLDEDPVVEWGPDVYYLQRNMGLFRNGRYCDSNEDLRRFITAKVNLHGQSNPFKLGDFSFEDGKGTKVFLYFKNEKSVRIAVINDHPDGTGSHYYWNGNFVILHDKLCIYNSINYETIMFTIRGDTLVYDRYLSATYSFDLADGTVIYRLNQASP